MAARTLEDRMAAVEQELAQLKQQLQAELLPAPLPWWEKIAGTFADSEAHEEATRLGREYREALRPKDEVVYMTQIVDAVYEHGTFRPITPSTVPLSEGQQVRLVVETTPADDILALASQVYDGLSEQDVNEVEEIALDRSAFFTRPIL